jgi:acylphosphatase
MINKNLYCFVCGKVKSVSFRKWIKMKFSEYSLRGWVKNDKDRRVELEVSKSGIVIREFIKIPEKELFFIRWEKLNLVKKKYEMSKEIIVLLS